MPPAAGNAAPSSATINAPAKASKAPAIHTSNTTASDGICCAITLGTRKIPEPTMEPAAILTPSRRRISLASDSEVAAGANDELIVTAALYFAGVVLLEADLIRQILDQAFTHASENFRDTHTSTADSIHFNKQIGKPPKF